MLAAVTSLRRNMILCELPSKGLTRLLFHVSLFVLSGDSEEPDLFAYFFCAPLVVHFLVCYSETVGQQREALPIDNLVLDQDRRLHFHADRGVEIKQSTKDKLVVVFRSGMLLGDGRWMTA